MMKFTPNLTSRDFVELDRGPWAYGFDSPELTSGHKHFVESQDFPDVRLYINGNFGCDTERESYGTALAAALNSVHAAITYHQAGRVAQRQLDALKSLAMMASSFPNELSKEHPDVVEAFAALNDAADIPSRPFALKEAPAFVQPYEQLLATSADSPDPTVRERAMLAEIAAWRAQDAARTQADTLTRGADGNYNTGHADLDLLLGLTDDMVAGNANMDTGILWMTVLERIQDSLGVPSQKEEPATKAGSSTEG
jgi:hypothetical protein